MKRKTLSILLAICMVFTLLPMQAFATEGGASTSTSSVRDSGTQGGEGSIKPDCTCLPVDSGEPTHDESCPLYKAEAVKKVLALIEALPTVDYLEAQNPDGSGLPAYLAQLRLDVAAARAAYDALTPEQKATFDAAALAKLMVLDAALAVPMLMSATAPNITIKVNGNAAASYIGASLQAAVQASGVAVGAITTLTITAGKVTEADWTWFAGGGSKTPVLSKLENFTIEDDDAVTGVANIPGNSDHNRNFPTSIKAVSIAKVTTIGQQAFYACTSLTTASFPNATSIGANAFYGCGALTTASFPAAKSIGGNAFYKCTSLTTASFPAATSIGNTAFGECTSLTTASFPAATSIGEQAFYDCKALTTLKLPAAPPEVENANAFTNCPADRSLVFVGANGNALTGEAFDSAQTAYTKVAGTDGKWIGWKIPTEPPAITIKVNGTTTVEGASLQEAVDAAIAAESTIANYAAITTLTITAGEVTAEDWKWFAGGTPGETTPKLTKLTSFTVDDAVTPVAGIPENNQGTAIFPKTIKTVSVAKVTTIGKAAFYDCKSLTTASFPAAITIEGNAFYKCTLLTTASFPAAKSIGNTAFYGCKKLTTVTFPAATTIGEMAFYDCTSLTTVTFPAAITIGKAAFASCTSLTTVTFPAATTIDYSAFVDCRTLTMLKLPAAPPNVANANAFTNCPADRSLVFVGANGNALTGKAFDSAQTAYRAVAGTDGKWIGWKIPTDPSAITITINGTTTVYGASLKEAVQASGVAVGAITTLTITAGKVTKADWEWFAGSGSKTPVLSKLENFTIEDTAAVTEVADIPGTSGAYSIFPRSIKAVSIAKVKTIGPQAFFICDKLTTASFPNATSIGANAFYGCGALTTASFPAAKSIGGNAFASCTSLTTASFPAATSIGAQAFYDCKALTTLKLPAAPPTVGKNAFRDCPADRSLVFVDADGNALTGNALNTAWAEYEGDVKDTTGTDTDNLWYLWKLPAKGAHTDIWATAWATNAIHHWHECTAESCPITENSGKGGYGIHDYDNDTDTSCSTCNYVRTITPPSHTHTWAAAWQTSTTHHWHECTAGSCPITENTGKGGYGTHDYDNDTDTSCNTCNYTRTITPPSHTITATAGSGGTISPSATVTSGGSQTFTISADSGYSVSSVIVDNEDQGAIGTYTFKNVTSNHTISATFIPNGSAATHIITASAEGGGKISPSGDVSVANSDDKTFEIVADSGYSISSVIVDGVDQGTISSYTFEDVTGDHTISASFTKNSSGGGSGSGSSSTTPQSSVINPVGSGTLSLLAEAVKTAVVAGKASVISYVNYTNYTALTADGLKAINDAVAAATEGTTLQLNTKIQLDNSIGGVVSTRMTIDPAKLTPVMPDRLNLNIWHNQATDTEVITVNEKFNKYFTNKLYTITFEEKTPLAVSTELALKPDFSGLKTQNLYFYSYNPTTNIYTRISAPAYWVDKNGYSHITAPLGGSIIVTDTPLTKR